MRKKSLIFGFALIWLAGWAGPVQAVEIARWNSSNSVPLAGMFAPTSQHVNVSVSNLVTSSNLLRTGSGPAANTFAAAGYSSADSNAAMTAGHYWETVIQPNSGYAVSYDTITYRFRRANSGPIWAQWAYSTNGVNFVWLNPAGSNTTGYTDKETPMGSVAALQNVTGKRWFRLYGWLGGTANTAWGAFGQAADVLTFSGTVGSSGPVLPTVAFNPSGSQSIPVSNTLTLAVSITPSGSGMSSWSLTPAYSGATSLAGGSFQFTPAAGDSGKTFTLSVVGTNSAGASTGTVSIAVTAYVPPVPVVAFSPASPYSIMATQTQKLGVAVTPLGSGMQGWSLLPSNYAGSASFSGTNFTFVSAQADGPATYTLSVVATNVYGSSTGTASIAVTAYVPPPVPGSYTASFEDASKTGYTAENVTLSNKVWNLAGILIGTSADDLKIGAKSARLKFDPTDGEESITSQSTLLTNGIGTISMWYGPFSNHGTNAPTLAIEISDNLSSGWVEMGSVNAGAVTELTYYSVDVFVSEPIYVRIRATSGVKDKSANFDNVTITPYAAPVRTPYDVFLLKYNVTPGDPGTAPDEDLDGDTFSNTNEFNAPTNPYDEAVHP